MPEVHWTVRARQHLREALARALAAYWTSPNTTRRGNRHGNRTLDDRRDRLDGILRKTFSGASALVVQDHLRGFRPKGDRHVLMVEVFGGDAPGAHIVKIGAEADLARELKGWGICRPSGPTHDLVFLPLTRGAREPPGGNPRMMSLIYGNAEQLIGVEKTSTLEAAALESVRFGSPSVQSVGFVLVELFERIGHLLYSQSFTDEPTRDGFVFDLPNLDVSIGIWEQEPVVRSIRAEANALVNHGISRFLDPVDYLRYVLDHVSWRTTNGALRRPRASARPRANLPPPRVAELVPRMLRGCAHGDLHGRNILVGVSHDRALWPTVFDYEHMGPRNLVGWDFVKLETELKIRAFAEIFSRQEGQFIREVRDFEIALNEETEKHHKDRSWPPVRESMTAPERLRALLLELRRMAAVQLGIDRGRPNQWLEEYYFLSACYGVTIVRFGNLERRELLGGYVSAGVAVARLSWPRDRLKKELDQLGR